MRQINTRTIIYTAILSAVSFVLFYFEIMVFPPLQMDFSDIPVIIAGYMFGFVPGFLVAIIKNVLHIMFISKNAAVVGELANLTYAVSMMIPFLFIKRNLHKNKSVLLTYIAAILLSTLAMSIFNYFIFMPMYGIESNLRWGMIVFPYLPFNLIKGAILCALVHAVAPQIDRMKRQNL